jgi:hypothetical protein
LQSILGAALFLDIPFYRSGVSHQLAPFVRGSLGISETSPFHQQWVLSVNAVGVEKLFSGNFNKEIGS